MPILVLSAVGEEDEKVRALAAGADDYVTKPFGPRELVARLQAALRRAEPGASEPVIEAEGLRIDLAAHTVSVDGAGVHLTPIEFNLLRVLATNRGRLLTHRTLLVDVWGPEYAERRPGPARAHVQPAAQDRRALPPHRPRRGLPLRALGRPNAAAGFAGAMRGRLEIASRISSRR